ncbi:DUF3159 domain-containing protein [Nonomuraea antimicrobica]
MDTDEGQGGGRRWVAPVIDTAVPVLGFLAGYSWAGLGAGGAAAMGAAAVLVGVRLLRGDGVRVVLTATGMVGLAVAVALLTGEARNFFVLKLVRVGATAAVLGGSVLLGRPVTRFVDRARLSFLPSSWRRAVGRVTGAPHRAHVVVTAAAALVCCARLTVMVPLYLADEVWLLGLADFALGAPVSLAWGWWSIRTLARAKARHGQTHSEAAA